MALNPRTSMDKQDAVELEDPLKSGLKNGEVNVFEPIDPEEERKLVRKLDMVILPLMALVYFFQCKSLLIGAFGRRFVLTSAC